MFVVAACGTVEPSTASSPPTSAGEFAGPTTSTGPPPEPSEPQARVYSHLIPVDSHPGVILLGGITTSPPFGGVFLGDTWLSSAPPAWTRADPGSAVPIGDAVAYDAGSDRVVVFAIVGPGPEPYVSVRETWAYDPGADDWSLVGTEQPEGLHGARATYDAESDRIIVISKEEAKVWAYDLDTDRWEERLNETAGIDTYNGIAYDSESDRVVTFGGGFGSGPGTTLAYDYNTNTWTDLSNDASPTDRFYQVMTYDPTTDRIIMFGGTQGNAETPNDETWAFDLNANTWTRLSPETTPGPRDRKSVV